MSLFDIPFEAIDSSDIQALIDHRVEENYRLEYKEDYSIGIPGNRDIACDITAFANASGGLIIIGISACKKNKTEPKDIVGISHPDDLTERIANVCAERIEPKLEFLESRKLLVN